MTYNTTTSDAQGGEKDIPLWKMPGLVRAYDAILGWVDRPVTAEQLMQLARRSTGLSDFGPEDFSVELRLLVDALNKAPFSHIGRRKFLGRVRDTLERRLWLEREFQRNPQLATESIRSPLVIVGFPRSGTTLLQNLLAMDPGARWLKPWEYQPPYVPADTWGGTHDPRPGRFASEVAELRRRFPHVDELHSLDGPEECWRLLLASFYSHTFFLLMGFEGYSAWFQASAEAAPRHAYAIHRRQLQLLQQHAKGTHWVLKAPEHTFQLPALLEAYPDARIIHLHRDPRKMVASACNLIAAVAPYRIRDLTGRRLGRNVMDFMSFWAERIVASRSTLPEANFCDVTYTDLTTRPIETIRRIHAHFGSTISDEYESALAKWSCSRESSPHRGSKHDLARFGITEPEIDDAFEHYRNRFLAPVDRTGAESMVSSP